MMIQMLPGDAEVTNLIPNHHSLAIARSGRRRRRYASRNYVRDLDASPMMFDLYSDNYCVDHATWQGVRGEVVGVQFPAVMVNQLLHAQGSGFHLTTTHELFDAPLTELTISLWYEAEAGGPRGALYAQGLSIALLGLLIERYGACRRADTKSRAKFSTSERLLLRDYIAQNLATDLSVEILATLVSMSPSHFSRAFKATFEMAPYGYVTERRIESASRILQSDTSRSIADIAYGLGFSSQSHFTEAFRRKIGTTPGRWRSRN
ncbi:AraC family transcriptional regulator [Burkholderia sp. BCC1993]|uniref:helix-turn-helix domain-containing protein n=1 Tax=Burkholderia sp. BCC1993 TaxID=2817444 RepID=UPI002AB0124F|nr:AraC family transcriptional regulator [Burkholderia sp. BCC1993]